jgi:hypothetical protein
MAPKRVDPTWDTVGGLGLSAGVHAHTQLTSPAGDQMAGGGPTPGLRGGSADADGDLTHSQKVQLAEALLQDHTGRRR